MLFKFYGQLILSLWGMFIVCFPPINIMTSDDYKILYGRTFLYSSYEKNLGDSVLPTSISLDILICEVLTLFFVYLIFIALCNRMASKSNRGPTKS